MSNIEFTEVPSQLTDSEARKILEEIAPQVKQINDEIVRNNTRAEEGERAKAELMKRANEHFGVDDGSGVKEVPGGEEGVKQILSDRMTENANRVRAFLEAFANAKEQIKNATKNTASR